MGSYVSQCKEKYVGQTKVWIKVATLQTLLRAIKRRKVISKASSA